MSVTTRILCATLLVCAATTAAYADGGGEATAKRKFFAGNEKLKHGDYVGAVAEYREAYADFPNPKILINLGVALLKLDRKVEAAEVYETYLESPDREQSNVPSVEQRLAEIDAELGRLEIEVEEPNARVLLDGKVIGQSPQKISRRVLPGPHMVAAEKDGYTPALATVSVNAGDERSVQLRLARPGKEPASPKPAREVASAGAAPDPEPGAEPTTVRKVRRPPGSRLGGLVRADIDGNSFGRGAVVTVGATFAVADRVQLNAGGIIGSNPGVFVGGAFFLTTGSLRPVVLGSVPVQFGDQTFYGVHGAAGLQWDPTDRLGLLLVAGVEHFLSGPDNFDKTLFVPSLGVQVRL